MVTKVRTDEDVLRENETLRRRAAELERGVALLGAQFREAGASLRVTEERLALVTENSPDLVFQQDTGYRYVWVSRKHWLELPEDMTGKTDLEIFESEEEARRVMAIKKSVMESGRGVRVELPGTIGGKLRYYDAVYEPWHDNKGGIIGVRGYLRDITERKRIEQALKESERRLMTLLSNLPGMVYRVLNDRQWTMLFASQGAVALTGYRPEDLTENKVTYASLIHPDDRQRVWDAVQASLHNRQPYKITYRIVTASGEEKWVWEQGRGVFSPDGKLQVLEGFIADITERKHSEEALRDREEILSSIFKSSQIGIGVVSYPRRVFLDVNDRVNEITGYRREELLGRNSRILYADDEAYERVRSVIYERRGSGIVDTRWLKKDGTRIDVLLSAAPLAPDNLARGVAFSFLDITDRKRAQERLQESNKRLRSTINGIIHTIVKIVETRDPYTAGHQKRVAQLAVAIAREMGLPEEQVNGLRMAAMIHDIGKIYIPSEILSKPGVLSNVEKEVVNLHPRAGYDILRMIEFPWPVAQIALEHQERYDGSGYPSHRAGGQILVEARILSVADVVEAMTFHRPYRPAVGIDKALAEIKNNSGTLYDPRVVDACVRLFTGHRFSFKEENR